VSTVAVRTGWYCVAYALRRLRHVGRHQKRRSTRSRRASTGAATAFPPATRLGKVRKSFWLDPRVLHEARAALGATTEREAVEMALDLVGFRKDLARSARALRRLTLSRID
jgi:hypothetical protein